MAILKQFIVKGAALSLICVATLAEAVPAIVQNASNDGVGSLRQAVRDINNRLRDGIGFRLGLSKIDLTGGVLDTFIPPITITGIVGLQVHSRNDPTNMIFNAGTAELHLIDRGFGGVDNNSNWYGSMTGAVGGTIRLDTQVLSNYYGIISGGVNVICQGLGTLTFKNAHAYTGGTNVMGALKVGITNALPTSGAATVAGTLQIDTGLTQTLSNLTGAGAVQIGNASSLIIDASTDFTFAGVMSDAGNFVKQGSGAFTLSGKNTYGGTTTILKGTLIAANGADGRNALPNTTAVTLSTNTSLEIADNNHQTLRSISGAGRIMIGQTAGVLSTLTAETLVDGSFSGNITTTNAGVFIKSGTGMLTLSGQNAGNLQLADGAGGIKISAGSSWRGPVTIGSARLEMNGGTVTQRITGNRANTSVLEITDTFTPSDAITDVGTINVRPGGNLLLTQDVVGAVGSIVNTGTITHTANTPRTIVQDFTQTANGALNFGITSVTAGQYSQLQVDGQTTLNGGTLNVQLSPGAEVKDGDVFDMITSTGGIAGGVLPTVPKTSLFFGFKPVITGNRLQLIANRSGCICMNTIRPLNGIAKKMDDLSVNSTFKPVLDILTQQTSKHAFEQKLEQLAPSGLKNEHIAIAQIAGAENQVLQRLDTLRAINTSGALASTGHMHTGYSAGDLIDAQRSYAPIVFGNSTKQSMMEGLSGYKATTAGFGVLTDMPILESYRVGVGVSYANSVVRQSNNTGSHTTIGSTQGMAYGSAHYGIFFLDTVLSAGINNYRGKRNITFLNQTATSHYTGSQYGAKIKTGVAIPCDQIEISPTAVVQYMHLNVGQYTEQGAGIANQHLSAIRTNTVRVSLGAKIADRNAEAKIFPEFHAFYLVDVKNPQVTVTARFVDGGGSFYSQSIVPPKQGVNLGASVTALISDDFTLSGGYDLEKKKAFSSHSVLLKFKFLF